MAILTSFLKLLKPERNDYVDVDKHISENYDKIDTKMQELNNSNIEKLDKGAVSEEYNTAKKIEDKIIGILETINNDNLSFRGIITDEATFNEAARTGWYKVKNYRVNNMYGFGILYVTKHEQTTLQIYYSHREGIAYRQDWDGNIRSATWTKIGESDLYKLTENFDPALLYLNDSGTKKVDKVYFDKNRKGLFLCIKQTTGTVNSAQNFIDISNKANYDRFKYLDKLTVTNFYQYNNYESLTLEQFLNEKLQKNRKLQIEFQGYGPYEVDMTKVGMNLGSYQEGLAEITFIQYSSSEVIFNNISLNNNQINESIHWAGGSGGTGGVFKKMVLKRTGLQRDSSRSEWTLVSKNY